MLLDLDLLGVCRRRHRIRHVNNKSDSTTDCGCRARGEIFFVSHAGLSKMDVSVDDTGENMFTFRVDLLFALGELVVRADGNEFLVADGHAPFEGFLRCHYPTILND